jgi:hypothetical protein
MCDFPTEAVHLREMVRGSSHAVPTRALSKCCSASSLGEEVTSTEIRIMFTRKGLRVLGRCLLEELCWSLLQRVPQSNLPPVHQDTIGS